MCQNPRFYTTKTIYNCRFTLNEIDATCDIKDPTSKD